MADFDATIDYYAVLGITSAATDNEIKAAARKAARENHPDANPNNREDATQKTRLILDATRVLHLKKDLKAQYDRERRLYHPSPSSSNTPKATDSHDSTTYSGYKPANDNPATSSRGPWTGVPPRQAHTSTAASYAAAVEYEEAQEKIEADYKNEVLLAEIAYKTRLSQAKVARENNLNRAKTDYKNKVAQAGSPTNRAVDDEMKHPKSSRADFNFDHEKNFKKPNMRGPSI